MRKFANLIAPVAAVAALSASSAYAADLPYTPPPSNSAIYAPAPVYNWTGFYVGASAGYGWGTATASTGSPFNISPDGGLVGGQIGYNYMMSNNLVLGIEGDLLWSGMSGSVTPFPTVTQSLDWVGTIRGRIGYAMGNWMPYFTGGFAAGGATRTSSFGPVSQSATHTGYVLGAGVEWAFAPQWTAKLEYQYLNLGSQTYTAIPAAPSVGITANTVRVGLNYKF